MGASVAQKVDGQKGDVHVGIYHRTANRLAAEGRLEPPSVRSEGFVTNGRRRVPHRPENDLAALVETVLHPGRHDGEAAYLDVRVVAALANEGRVGALSGYEGGGGETADADRRVLVERLRARPSEASGLFQPGNRLR